MAITIGFLIATVARALIILCLYQDSIQATRAWRNNKKSFRQSVINSQARLASLERNLLDKENHNIQQRDFDVGLEEPIVDTFESLMPNSPASSIQRRTKRRVFLEDERKVVPQSYIEKCPFEAAVMISTGCSGTLISPRHVLTSAHCLHNGSHYVDGFRNLRVGFLLNNGTTEWHAISYTKIPKQWKNGSDLSATMYDYALIRLARNHNRCFLPIAPSKAFFYNNNGWSGCAHKGIHFTAFDEDREQGTMLFRKCRVMDFNASMLFHCCDAKRGSSGAGVYEFRNESGSDKYERYVVGVFSGNRDILKRHRPHYKAICNRHHFVLRNAFYNRWLNGPWVVNYNAALRLKASDVFHICTWMKRLGGELCKKIIRERRRRRRQSRRRRDRGQLAYARCEGKL